MVKDHDWKIPHHKLFKETYKICKQTSKQVHASCEVKAQTSEWVSECEKVSEWASEWESEWARECVYKYKALLQVHDDSLVALLTINFLLQSL